MLLPVLPSLLAAVALSLLAQPPSAKAPAGPSAPSNPFQMSPEERARLDRLSREDHADMMSQLGITKLRPGYDGWAKAGEPNAANYDPAQANPYPDWPDVLTRKDGSKVTTPQMWWQERRPEIVEDFEREVYGRVPADVPKVTWTVAETVDTKVGGQPVVARRVIGHVDNSARPSITVDIRMGVVVPVNAKGPVPVLVMFGWGNLPDEPVFRFPGMPEPAAPPSTEQLIASGWGYVSLATASIQADNGAGLTAGIIGLTNKGKRRTPEQWGALRAWAWGAARALDYLETLPAVDAKRVGIEGVSRYGKAALVTMAFEPRFAAVLVGSSGEGGVKPHRRHFGEAVENLAGSGAYHWMAGNFLKYAAEEAPFGRKTANDLPVDAHELLALCAPRPTFVSYGVPEKGDAHWLDQQGSFMATVAAGPVFRLLGVPDLGVAEDYRAAKMPPVNTGLLDGALAWRQHDGGHEDRTNMSFFIAWANRLLGHTPPPTPADQPRMRADRNSHLAHQQLLAKAKTGGIDLYFLGDSITRRWGATDYPDLLAHWNETFHGWNAGNFGWGGDRTENILWRLENGELDGVNPKVIVLLAGTNNVGKEPGSDAKVADVARGLLAIVDTCRKKAPAATIVLTAIFPRNDNPAVMPTIARINANIAKMADGKSVRFLDVNARLADASGSLFEGMMPDGLHPSLKGYSVWAEGLRPILTELLGPPAATDHAPPPTGDPSAAERPRPLAGAPAPPSPARIAELSEQWVDPVTDAPPGTTYRLFETASRGKGTKGSYLIYLPPSYETETARRYPVVYWLHGGFGNARQGAWAVQHLDEGIRAGRVPETIVVLPQALPVGWYVNSKDGKRPIEDVLIKDLVPHVDATWRTLARRESRGIEGMSMGGYGALHLGMKYPSLFGAISSVAPSILRDLKDEPKERTFDTFADDEAYYDANGPWAMARENAAALRRGGAIRLLAGDRDARLRATLVDFHELLTQLGIPHQFSEVKGAGHVYEDIVGGLGDEGFAFWRRAFSASEPGAAAP